MNRLAVVAFASLLLVPVACRPPASSAEKSPSGFDQTQEPGYYQSAKHGYSVRFVDDWTVDTTDEDHVIACSPDDPHACIALTAIAAIDDDPELLLNTRATQLAARLDAFKLLVRESAPEDAGALPFLLYEYTRPEDAGLMRAIEYFRTDGQPAICVGGHAPAERFAEYATGFRLTATALHRTK